MPSQKLIIPTVPHVFPRTWFSLHPLEAVTHFRHCFLQTPHTTPHAPELRVTFHCSDRDNFFLGTPSGGVSPTAGGGICGITSAAHELVERPQECSSSQTSCSSLGDSTSGRWFLFNTHSCVLCLALSPPPNFGRITAKIKTGWRTCAPKLLRHSGHPQMWDK